MAPHIIGRSQTIWIDLVEFKRENLYNSRSSCIVTRNPNSITLNLTTLNTNKTPTIISYNYKHVGMPFSIKCFQHFVAVEKEKYYQR